MSSPIWWSSWVPSSELLLSFYQGYRRGLTEYYSIWAPQSSSTVPAFWLLWVSVHVVSQLRRLERRVSGARV